jgi:hypothetical protein
LVAVAIFSAGFGSGYLIRHQISLRRRRDVERRHGIV